jgi:DNA modification methylase
LPEEFVHCCVTSPPYWGLRDYKIPPVVWPALSAVEGGGEDGCAHKWGPNLPAAGNRGQQDFSSTGLKRDGRPEASRLHSAAAGEQRRSGIFSPGNGGAFCACCGAWRGCYGLEPTVDLYVEHTVEILRAIRRVLRADGTVWWNIGDCYDAGTRAARDVSGGTKHGYWNNPAVNLRPRAGLKPKDLCLIPFRVALAAQTDGWWMRSVIIWAKPNPMPESVTDRPTTAHEYILLLTKSGRYFYDQEAVRETSSSLTRCPLSASQGDKTLLNRAMKGVRGSGWADDPKRPYRPGTRNLRSVWTHPTQPYKGAHFATFPERLPATCILAGTSAKGCCPKCGAPWARVVEKTPATMNIRVRDAKRGVTTAEEGYRASDSEIAGYGPERMGTTHTLGWKPTCSCDAGEPVPCRVLDPFVGAGTTALVALQHGRHFLGCELNPKYVRMTRARIAEARQQAGLTLHPGDRGLSSRPKRSSTL